MSRFVNIQTNFTTGELDPLLRSRVDLQAYNNALEVAKNVTCQPQGGVKRRPGTKFINELGGSPANGVRLVHFEFSVDDSYMLAFTNNRMYVYKDKALVTNINGSGNDYLTTTIASAQLGTMCYTQSADTLIVVHEDIAPKKIVRGASDSAWTISDISFDSIPQHAYTLTIANTSAAGTLTPSDVSGKITLTTQHGFWTTAHVGQYVNAEPQGRARIVERLDSTRVNAVVEFPFFDTSAIANADWELETGYEDVWSSSKGWPRSVTFHQGRLYFGGSKSRPSTIWGSKVSLFFDFEPVEGLDDDAFVATLDTNQLNTITDVLSANYLQIFTTGGEFFAPQDFSDPLTPSNFIAKLQSSHGSKENIRVQNISGSTIYIQRQGKALNEVANPNAHVLVVGNPCNTNALIAAHYAPNLNKNHFYGMMMLDELRARAQIANKLNVLVEDVDNMIVWGNHSATQFPDYTHAQVKGKAVTELCEEAWLKDEFISTNQKRGAAVIAARGASSAASAVNAALETMKRVEYPDGKGNWKETEIEAHQLQKIEYEDQDISQ